MKHAHLKKYKILGLKISYYRKLYGLTQEQLAEKIDKSLPFIGSLEAPNISSGVSLDTIFDIADALEIPPSKFFEFENE